MIHLDALNLRLSNERAYLFAAKSKAERELRTVWIAQIEKEIQSERAFLGLPPDVADEMSDDELMAVLMA
jgi:hypothetical protein